MWRYLSISLKITLCMFFLIVGYSLSMVYVHYNERHIEHLLDNVSLASFPASLKSQSAVMEFRNQLRLYKESVMLGETGYVVEAQQASDIILEGLESIRIIKPMPSGILQHIKDISQRLKDYTASANEVYTRMASNETVDYKTIQDTVKKAKEIENKLADLNRLCDRTLRSSLSSASQKIKQQAVYNMAAFFLFLFLSILVMWFVISRSIVRPLKQTVEVLKQVSQGDLSVRLTPGHDEIGVMGQSLNAMVSSLERKVGMATAIAHGNLDVNVDVASEKDRLGIALKTMIMSLNRMAAGLLESADQVDSGSKQVAELSRALTSVSMEQSAALEEASAAVSTIDSKTKTNAGLATQANRQTEEAFSAATHGSERMTEMVTAMEQINQSTKQIEKINKTIDEIAFQINLLSLNAAIEAARAGKHGKGFAVVAQEVRNLAMKSARAVRETSVLIEKAVTNVNNGNRIAKKTADSFSDIHEHIAMAANLVSQIASLSHEQSFSINQTSGGLLQLVNSTQKNSAAAEQTSSAATELSCQAAYVRSLINRYRIKKLPGHVQGDE